VAPTAPATGTPYTIQAGDSLWGIARDNGTTVEAIKQLNGLTSDTIVAGKTLMIPAR
jgi:D-gamma-glutamyl-meso-diaminopimelic acid endopeptidase CwlS